MQRKKSAADEKSSGDHVSGSPGGADKDAAAQPRVGRPPTSALDRKSQVRENVRVHRARLRAAGLEKVETYLPKAWRQFLQDTGEPLQQLGLEAFALLLKARGASALVQAAQPESTADDPAD